MKQPLTFAHPSRQVKPMRSQAKTRVQLHGQKIACSREKVNELKAYMKQEMGKQAKWRQLEWKSKVEEIGAMCCWGALTHGGHRKQSAIIKKEQLAICDEARAIGDVGPCMVGDEARASGQTRTL